jgi:hypothetical protein
MALLCTSLNAHAAGVKSLQSASFFVSFLMIISESRISVAAMPLWREATLSECRCFLNGFWASAIFGKLILHHAYSIFWYMRCYKEGYPTRPVGSLATQFLIGLFELSRRRPYFSWKTPAKAQYHNHLSEDDGSGKMSERFSNDTAEPPQNMTDHKQQVDWLRSITKKRRGRVVSINLHDSNVCASVFDWHEALDNSLPPPDRFRYKLKLKHNGRSITIRSNDKFVAVEVLVVIAVARQPDGHLVIHTAL